MTSRSQYTGVAAGLVVLAGLLVVGVRMHSRTVASHPVPAPAIELATPASAVRSGGAVDTAGDAPAATLASDTSGPSGGFEIADEVEGLVFRELPAVMGRLAQMEEHYSDDDPQQRQEWEELCASQRDIVQRAQERMSELMASRNFVFVDLFSKVLKDSPDFKMQAAAYLAVAGTPEAITVLKEALSGPDLRARSCAATVLTPILLAQTSLDEDYRRTFRKILSDDVSAPLTTGGSDAQGRTRLAGAGGVSEEELTRTMRIAAARVLVHFQDEESLPLLLDMETGRRGPSLTGEAMVGAYRGFAQWGTRNPPARLVEGLTGIVDRWLKYEGFPQDLPPGNPIAAAFVLEAMGVHGRVADLKAYYRRQMDKTANAFNTVPVPETGSLLALRDASVAETVVGWLSHPDERMRDRAVSTLVRATGQAFGTNGELGGTGTPEDKARWASVQAQWREWWTQHGAEFAQTNPFAPPSK